MSAKTLSFSARIQIIGINPYVLLPAVVLKTIFEQAGKDKGAIPVKGKLGGKPFLQNLVKYSGKWRLYLNTPMREAAGIDVGDRAEIEIAYDPKPRTTPMPPPLEKALDGNPKAKKAFAALPPSRQKEIMRYLGFLKTEESMTRNIGKVMKHLLEGDSFIGR